MKHALFANFFLYLIYNTNLIMFSNVSEKAYFCDIKYLAISNSNYKYIVNKYSVRLSTLYISKFQSLFSNHSIYSSQQYHLHLNDSDSLS